MKLAKFKSLFVNLAFAAIGGAATLLIQYQLDRYKHRETQRLVDVDAAVKACDEVWAALNDYEAGLAALEQLEHERWFFLKAKGADPRVREEDIAGHAKESQQGEAEVLAAIRKRRFYLGEDVAGHFYRYVGFLRMRKDAKSSLRQEDSAYSRKISEDFVQLIDAKLASMRFSAGVARDYALRQAL
jgi:hypothetical protein